MDSLQQDYLCELFFSQKEQKLNVSACIFTHSFQTLLQVSPAGQSELVS